MQFYLGTHVYTWLYHITDIPLFLSYNTLRKVKTYKSAQTDWALDSAGFSELSKYGTWVKTENDYIRDLLKYQEQLGRLQWAAPQDWMCEPVIIAKTGKTVQYHQERTIESVLSLRSRLAGGVHIIPVLQGYTPAEYLTHVEMYDRAGFNLTQESLVGVGSVCRRQSSNDIAMLFETLHTRYAVKMHGFGVKKDGIRKSKQYLASSDSLAWSFNARYNPPLTGCTHKNCANCIHYARKWYKEIQDIL